MNNFITIQKIADGYLPVQQLYDYIRLVDPINKRVEANIHPQIDEDNTACGHTCYNFWQQGRVCENCISARAYQAKDAYVKMEYNGEQLFLITAVALEVDGQQRVLELLKDITKNGLLDIRGKNNNDIYQMVGEINDLVVRDILTGSYNKLYAYERLPYELSLSKNSNGGLSVIFVSIDNLERIKNADGYIAADQAVKEFTGFLAANLQNYPESWLARLGESEFLLVLPATPENEALQLYDGLNQGINGTELVTAGSHTSIKASFGLHNLNLSSQVLTAGELMACVDTGIYMARIQAKSSRIDPCYDSFVARYALSKRECEVCKLLLEGRTNDDIAHLLFIGIPTVKKHISNIYQKTGVNSRAEYLALYQSYQTSYLS